MLKVIEWHIPSDRLIYTAERRIKALMQCEKKKKKKKKTLILLYCLFFSSHLPVTYPSYPAVRIAHQICQPRLIKPLSD